MTCIHQDEGDEEDLDDDAMLKIDDALSRAFHARKKSQTTKKERKGKLPEPVMS